MKRFLLERKDKRRIFTADIPGKLCLFCLETQTANCANERAYFICTTDTDVKVKGSERITFNSACFVTNF